MKIENIRFTTDSSERVYREYMRRIKKVTQSLSQKDQDDIYMEFNSHIYEAIQHKTSNDEIDVLLDILDKLGAPEEVLKPLIADKKLEEATRTFNPVKILKALVLNFTNGVSYIIFFTLYLLTFGFVFLMIAKIINPAQVGFYYKDTSLFVLGITRKPWENGVHEVLGNWFIPVMILLALTFYILITFLLKFKKSINKK